jgi:hypothetical protein
MGATACSSSSQQGDVIKDALTSNHHQWSMNANISKRFRNLINYIRKPTVANTVAEVPSIKKCYQLKYLGHVVTLLNTATLQRLSRYVVMLGQERLVKISKTERILRALYTV